MKERSNVSGEGRVINIIITIYYVVKAKQPPTQETPIFYNTRGQKRHTVGKKRKKGSQVPNFKGGKEGDSKFFITFVLYECFFLFIKIFIYLLKNED